MRKIISGDQVYVTTGRDKGKTGRVLKVIKKTVGPKTNNKYCCKITISNINIRKYIHKTPNGKKIESKEFPIDISNVLLVDARDNSPSKVGFKIIDGIKKRYFKKSGEFLD